MKVFCYVKGRVRWIISVQVNVPLKLPKYMGQIQVVQEMRNLREVAGREQYTPNCGYIYAGGGRSGL